MALLTLLAIPKTTAAGTRYVSLSGSNCYPYTNWIQAATNIQPAVDAASHGDIVIVAPGIYYLTNHVLITQAIILVSAERAEQTIVDGQHTVQCFYINAPGAVLNGFTIRNGYAPYVLGGGSGGGVMLNAGLVIDCTVASNTAWFVGGLYCGPLGIVERCTFVGNQWLSWGISDVGCVGGAIRSCTIAGNRSGGADDIAVLVGDAGLIENCLIAENCGYGVQVSAGSTGIVQNCTITANHSGGLWNAGYGIVSNSIIIGNGGFNWSNETGTCSFTHTCIDADVPGMGNITNNPQLTPDYRLKASSPCIDAGTSSNAPATDIDGETRWDDPRHTNVVSAVDIGADEFVDTDLDNLADCWETNKFGSITNKDGLSDGDADQLSDLGEYENATNPTNSDTDADGMPDGWEVVKTLDPRSNDAGSDTDSDSSDNLSEYIADTDPTNAVSVLALTGIQSSGTGALTVDWKGGTSVWQYLERRQHIDSTSEVWTVIRTNSPPTAPTDSATDENSTNDVFFYRIRAVRL